jgi:hypothetical protein
MRTPLGRRVCFTPWQSRWVLQELKPDEIRMMIAAIEKSFFITFTQ